MGDLLSVDEELPWEGCARLSHAAAQARRVELSPDIEAAARSMAEAGLASMGGTFDPERLLVVLLRGVVRTTWLGGIGAPDRRWAYIRSRPWMMYRCRGMNRVW
jgi:hypothetical protein